MPNISGITRMSDPMLHPEDELPPDAPRGKSAAWRLGVTAIGLGLLAGCIYLASEEIGSGWGRLMDAEASDIALMMAMVVASLAVNALVFWAVIIPFRPDKPVKLHEMGALIAATSLLNYLPMRAGLIGRAAYLKQQHELPYRLSVVMMLFVGGSTAVVYLWLVGVTAALREWSLGEPMGTLWWSLVVGGYAAMAMAGWVVVKYGRSYLPKFVLRYFDDAELAIAWFGRVGFVVGSVSIFVVLALRAVDVGFTALRLSVMMTVLGEPIGVDTAILLATMGMLATLLTPLPNGIGLREVLYGGISENPVLGLLDRAVEALVFVVVGVVGLVYVHQRTVGSGKPEIRNPKSE